MRSRLALMVGLALAAGASAPAMAQKDLVIARAISANALDPGFLREAGTLVDNVFDTLIMRDKDMKLVPGLATEWKPVDDTTWEFKLRPGVKFHNGEPMDAAAVKFTFDRVLDPAAKSPTISYITTVAGVDVVDPMTVRVRTKAPDPLLPTRMSRYPAYVVPPKYIAEVGPEVFSNKPIGTGPYKVTEFVRDDRVVMVANADYWRGKPAIEKVTWRPIPEATARIAALVAGEVHLIEGVPADLVPVVRGNPDLAVEQVRHGGLTIYLGLKMAEKPLDNPKVRRALSLAIDRKGIVDNILKGLATLNGSQVSPADFGYKAIAPTAYDPAAAKALLAEAGYPNGFTIRMQTPRRYISSAEVGQVVAQQFAAIGVKVELEVPEWSVYTQQVPAGKQAPIYLLGWGSTQTLDADAAVFAIARTGEPYSTVSIPALDALLDESRKIVDKDKRAEVLARIQDVIAAETPFLTLYQEDSLYGKRKNLVFSGRADARIPVFEIKFQ